MKSLKIVVAESQKTSEMPIRIRLANLGFDVVEVVESPRKLIEVLELRRVDIVLSNIFSDAEYSGSQLADLVREQYHTPILFISPDDNPKLYSIFTLMPSIGLLVRPFTDLELKINLLAAIENYKQSAHQITSASPTPFNNYLFVRSDYKLNRIRIADIYYVEARKDYITINTHDNVYTVHTTMRELHNALPGSQFIRIHRSYIVNIDRIFSIKYPDLVVENKMKVLPIGGLYRKDLFDKLNVL